LPRQAVQSSVVVQFGRAVCRVLCSACCLPLQVVVQAVWGWGGVGKNRGGKGRVVGGHGRGTVGVAGVCAVVGAGQGAGGAGVGVGAGGWGAGWGSARPHAARVTTVVA